MNIIAKICNKRLPNPLGQWRPVPPGEEKIVWLQDPTKFPFVRTRIFESSKRASKPKCETDGILVGYSILDKNQSRNMFHAFERRYFYLTPRDLRCDCVYLKENCHPAEGVDPKTVRPGEWGKHLQPLRWPLLSRWGANSGD